MQKNILIIGGTGIIGKATIKEAFNLDYSVTTIGLIKDETISNKVNQVIVDRNKTKEYETILAQINKGMSWDIVFDVYALTGEDAKQTYNFFKNNAKHIFIISTTLVYDRSFPSDEPIKTTHPLATKGMLGGYVDHKLELENFWHSINDVNWTILRPYHIIGAGSLLGCLPDHNRDPKLLSRIKDGEELLLCDEGSTILQYIHPIDIAKVVLKAAGNPITFHKAYNAVNPSRIIAKDYFEIIGNILNKKVCIKNKPIKEIWFENKGWQLTALPHIYDVSDLEKDIGLIPGIPIETAIKEAIDHYPREQDIINMSVHERMTLLPRPKLISWMLKR